MIKDVLREMSSSPWDKQVTVISITDDNHDKFCATPLIVMSYDLVENDVQVYNIGEEPKGSDLLDTIKVISIGTLPIVAYFVGGIILALLTLIATIAIVFRMRPSSEKKFRMMVDPPKLISVTTSDWPGIPDGMAVSYITNSDDFDDVYASVMNKIKDRGESLDFMDTQEIASIISGLGDKAESI